MNTQNAPDDLDTKVRTPRTSQGGQAKRSWRVEACGKGHLEQDDFDFRVIGQGCEVRVGLVSGVHADRNCRKAQLVHNVFASALHRGGAIGHLHKHQRHQADAFLCQSPLDDAVHDRTLRHRHFLED